MAEIIKRIKAFGVPCTLWASKDPEGRRVYAVSRDRGGVAVEPQGGWRYTQRLTRLAGEDATKAETDD